MQQQQSPCCVLRSSRHDCSQCSKVCFQPVLRPQNHWESEHFSVAAEGTGVLLQSLALMFPILRTWPFKRGSLFAMGWFHAIINDGIVSVIMWMMLQLQRWEIKSWHMLVSMQQLSGLPAECHQAVLEWCHIICTVTANSDKLTWSLGYIFLGSRCPVTLSLIALTNSVHLSISTFRLFQTNFFGWKMHIYLPSDHLIWNCWCVHNLQNSASWQCHPNNFRLIFCY